MKKKNNLHPLNQLEAEIAITSLYATGDYLVLRKINLDRCSRFIHKTSPDARIGVCLDTETTSSLPGDSLPRSSAPRDHLAVRLVPSVSFKFLKGIFPKQAIAYMVAL